MGIQKAREEALCLTHFLPKSDSWTWNIFVANKDRVEKVREKKKERKDRRKANKDGKIRTKHSGR